MEDTIMNVDWIEEYEKEDKSYKMFYPEPVSRIKVNILYVNKKNELEKIREEFIYLSVSNLIKKGELIRLIKSYDISDEIKYKLVSIVVYNIDIRHDELKNYLSGYEKYNFITSLRNIEDYELKSTLNYLQQINNIYIVFNEEEKKEIPSAIKKIRTYDDNTNTSTNTSTSNSKHKTTKRVKFSLPKKKTRRRKY